MLDTDPDNLQLIVDEIIFFHRNNRIIGNVPGVTINPATHNLNIQYGYGGRRYGAIEISYKQFEVVSVTDSAGRLVPLKSYNHEGKNSTEQDYIKALKCNDLNTNQTYVSAIVIMTSEAARSSMVLSALQALFTKGVPFSDEVWTGIEFAVKTYKHTAEFLGYDIKAGGSPWRSLRADDYIAFIKSDKYKGDKRYENNIRAVKEYSRGF